MLRSFSFIEKEYSDAELLLFEECLTSGYKPKYAPEILNNARAGRIRLDGSFNIRAYEAKIDRNNTLLSFSKAKKEIGIAGSSATDEEFEGGSNFMTEDTVTAQAAQIEPDFTDDILNSDELLYAVRGIKSLQKVYLFDEGIDIIKLLCHATDTLQADSVDLLTKLCNNDEVVKEYIRIILSSGKSLQGVLQLC